MRPLASIIDDVDDDFATLHAKADRGWAINNASSKFEKGRQIREGAGPDGVVAYHAALSRLRPGFKSRSGRQKKVHSGAIHASKEHSLSLLL